MTSPITYPVDDKDLDDAALWAVIDSAAAASLSSSKSGKPLALKNTNHNNSPPLSSISKNPRNHHTPGNNFRFLIDGDNNSPPLISSSKNPRNHHTPGSNFRSLIDVEVLQEHLAQPRPQKMARSCVSELSETSPLAMVRHVQKLPTTPSYRSPDSRRFPVKECSPTASESSPIIYGQCDEKETMRHSLSGRFPSVSLFKEYQSAAMAILEKTDYTLISGRPFIKKTGWRKISCYFNISYEIKDKTIEFDENRNVQRSEFVVRAYMHGGRFSDGWGSCERREKKFLKPNNDIPSTAETRAKNKACQDLLGIGEYLPGASHAQ